MHILIIDDNPEITENISLYLNGKWYITSIASDGEKAFDMIMRTKYDFLIIDRMMPHINGLALVRLLKAKSIVIPFLFLTALGKQADKIEWLSLGADDYLVKPFDLQELVLRIENITRRNKMSPHSANQSNVNNIFESDWVILDATTHIVTYNWINRDLAPKEYELLEILFRNRWKILDRDFLYERVWWDYDVNEKILETINVHIAHLRKKLSPNLIRTVKLIGYIID
jgi:DNA-binding response OmpR family regulator